MMIRIGTSGYNYPEWRGSFYPEGLSEAKMLPYYAERFSTVEINYSFYRLPNPKAVQGWLDATPPGFCLTLKAPRRITHDSRLQNCGELLSAFCDRARLLGDKAGALLFQLPGFFRKNVPVLESFLAILPDGLRPAFEFRSDTWFSDDVYEALRAKNAALCIADSEKLSTPVVSTAGFSYFRLRDEGYSEADIARWAEVIRKHAQDGREVFVYFKHEETGRGAEFGRMLRELLEAP